MSSSGLGPPLTLLVLEAISHFSARRVLRLRPLRIGPKSPRGPRGLLQRLRIL